jgi:hypothetical protein
LKTLLKILSFWAAVTDGPSDDAIPDVVTLGQQLGEGKRAWEKARESARVILGTLTSERLSEWLRRTPDLHLSNYSNEDVCLLFVIHLLFLHCGINFPYQFL